MTTHTTPMICIVDTNTLAVLGLKNLLHTAMPSMHIDNYGSMLELLANHPEQYVHFFVAMNIVLENRSFFTLHARKTIVLTTSAQASSQLAEFHCLCVNVPEKILIRELLAMLQYAHGPNGRHPMPQGNKSEASLTPREAEVMVLIVKGYINKEIASKLNIGITTVITHRKNIMEKLKMKSVSALTVYAVLNGYVNIEKI